MLPFYTAAAVVVVVVVVVCRLRLPPRLLLFFPHHLPSIFGINIREHDLMAQPIAAGTAAAAPFPHVSLRAYRP